MKRKLIALGLVLVMAVSLLAGCSNKEAASTNDASEVTLAIVGPQTGDNAEYGKSMKTAAQIAVDEWNEKGGVIGKQIKLVDYDDANSSEQAASVAEKIVGDPSICAVMGHFSSGVAMTAAEVYQEAGIALVNGSAAHMDYAKIGDCIFRNNAIYTTDANTMLQIMEWLGVKKFGILNPNTDAGVSVTSAVEDMMERYGDMLVERFASLLDREGGDLFAAFLDLYDEIASRLGGGPCRELAEIIRRNRQMQPGALLAQPGPEAVLDRLRSRLDLSRLDLRSQEDLTDLFHLLVFCLAGALRTVEREGTAAARDHLARALDLLRRGAAAKECPAGSNL